MNISSLHFESLPSTPELGASAPSLCATQNGENATAAEAVSVTLEDTHLAGVLLAALCAEDRTKSDRRLSEHSREAASLRQDE